MSFCLAIIFPASHCLAQFLFPSNVIRLSGLWTALGESSESVWKSPENRQLKKESLNNYVSVYI